MIIHRHGDHTSYIDFPNSLKNKKAAINLTNKSDNKCFQYALTLELNYKQIGKGSEKIINIKPFIDKHNRERKNYPSEKNDWKIFEKNDLAIALNVLYAKKENIYPAYVSKHNSKRKKGSYSFNDSKRREMVLPCSKKCLHY